MTYTGLVPDLTLNPLHADTTDKFGGLPMGLPARLWPVCAECQTPMGLCAQLDHEDGRLDLGRRGRRLFVFQCENPEQAGVCETWEQAEGANAAFIVEPEDLVGGWTPAPTADTPVLSAVFVARWRDFESVRAEDERDDFRFHLYDTRIGGEPAWVQGDDEADQEQWRYLAQFSGVHRFLTPPLEDHPELNRYATGCTMEAANYGGGNGYVFIERDPKGSTPKALFFWQC